MTILPHNPERVARPLGNYSHGVEVRHPQRLLFISGQIPTLSDGEVPRHFAEQCEAVWDNILAILQSAGMGIENLVKITTFLTHADQIEMNGAIRRRRLGDHCPALTIIIAQTLDSAWLLEIEAIAVETESP